MRTANFAPSHKLTLVGFLFFLGSAPFSARADLPELMEASQADKNDVAVIVQVPESDDQDYGLLLTPKADFAQELGLWDPNLLENANYRIVENESEKTLPVGDFDGDNVLYHLMKAHDYYLSLAQKTGAQTANFFRKITVRVRMDHLLNSSVHFSNKLFYDNSCYITNHSNEGFGPEIWFYQRKTEYGKMDWYTIATNTGSSILTKNWLNLGNVLPDVVNEINGGIDTAKLPNVIYHEDFHYSSDYDNEIPMPDSGNPVGEDYANYFGSSMTGKPTIAEIKAFSGRFYTRHYQKVRPVKNPGDNLANNPELYNSQPFVPSLFWKIRDKLGQARADELIFRSLKFIKGGIFETLIPGAILSAAHEQSDLNSDDIAFLNAEITQYTPSFVNLEKIFYPTIVIESDPAVQTIQAELVSASDYEKDQMTALVNTLKEEGIEITEAEEQRFGLLSQQFQAEAKKPGFALKVLRVLGMAGIKVGEGLAYTASAASSVLNAPVNFGTELSVATVSGHPMGGYQSEKVVNQLIGAGGGLSALYYLDLGLSAIGNPLPLNLSLTGVVLIEGIVCADAASTQTIALKAFCEKNQKIISNINHASDEAGDKSGEAIHQGMMKITKLFRHSKNKAKKTSPPS